MKKAIKQISRVLLFPIYFVLTLIVALTMVLINPFDILLYDNACCKALKKAIVIEEKK